MAISESVPSPEHLPKACGPRYAALTATAVLGVLASFAACLGVANWEHRLLALKLEELAKNHEQTINADLSYAAETVYTLRAFFDSNEHPVTRTEYQAFAKTLRERLAGLRDTGWAVRVTRDQRDAFERTLQGEGFPNFQIWERDSAGKPMRAAERDEYFPILFPDPAEVTAKVIGFDIASEPVRAQTLQRARATGRPAATPPMNLITVNQAVGGFMSFLPVYGPGVDGGGTGSPPLGFVYGVFETGRMIENILAMKTRPVGLDIYLFDPHAAPEHSLIYWHSSRTRATPVAAPSEAELLAGAHWRGALKVADQEWGAIYRPTEKLVAASLGWQPYVALATGLCLTCFMVVYLVVSLRRTARLEFLTASLSRTTEELRREGDKVAHLARHDAMTGLANRATFTERLHQAFTSAKCGVGTFAVLCLDLDHFKDVNDTLGHPQGDALLQIVANRLRQLVRPSDLIARLGGDEFAILALNAPHATVGALATRINESLAKPYNIGDNEVRVSASIGISLYSHDIASPDEIMMHADLALYRTKAAGRNRFCFYCADLDGEVRARVAIAGELHTALQRGELELYYQPQVEIPSGRIVGLEAVVRWNHPSRGVLSPKLFIPVAETTGTVVGLGRWVLQESCGQIARWRAAGLATPLVAINMSAAQFKAAPTLDRELNELFVRHGIDPAAVEIEVTESMFMEATEANRAVIEDVRALGVGVAIDDFGTGYSSLEYLQSFRISRLKIAQNFIQGLGRNPGDAAIVRAALGLARELDIDVIAEGVETADQVAFLEAVGCRHVQGYYFSPPVRAPRAAEMLRLGAINPGEGLATTDAPVFIPVKTPELAAPPV